MAHVLEARCLHCGQLSLILNESSEDKPPKPVIVRHYQKSLNVTNEQLREEQRKAKRETNKLREELTSAKENLESERLQRKRGESDLNKAQSDSLRLEEELKTYKKEFEKFVTENEQERLDSPCKRQDCIRMRASYLLSKTEKETKKVEETVRSGPITREDVQCMMESYRALTEQNKALIEIMASIKIELSSLRNEKTELEDTIMAHKFSICDLEQNCATLEKEKSDLLSQLSHYQQQCNDGRCQQLAAECERILKEHEHMHNVLTSAECRRQKCVQMAQRITDLQQQLTGQAEQFKKLSLNKHMAQQQDTAHDQLNMEYEELWTNPDIILERLEECFDDSFDAKCFLTDLFMDAYKKSKRNLLRLLYRNMDELYKVQPESRRVELEGLSRAYGLLLHSSGAKTLVTQSEAVGQISEEIKNTLQKIPRFSEVGGTLKTTDLQPLDRVVEVAWKFVTQACPIVVCQPERFSEELHRTCFDHWDENHDDSKPLIYARPVVYRSYHCVVLNRALVGNM